MSLFVSASRTPRPALSLPDGPLLLVKPRQIADPPRVMVAVDPVHEHDKPAALDDALFRFGEALAHAADGELHLVHAMTMPLGLQLPPEAAQFIVNEHTVAMKAFLSAHEVPVANVHMMQGLAHKCLQSAATEHAADFLVMGAVARRGLSKLFIGSTADRTLDRLPCDLVVIKPPHFVVPSEEK